ncbi:MAG TPA: tetratricopeptide repeat protein [Phycisphaerales bacterium]|nr:tetratricopeptide repeat protein [Phycisphaerales bacterium]
MSRVQVEQIFSLLQAGRLAEAEQRCRQALNITPADIQLLKLLGRITREVGKAEQSVRIFQQLSQSRPTDLQLAGELGASLVRAGRQQQAIPLLQRAAEAMPQRAEWRQWLGRAYMRSLRHGPAVAHLREAARLEPGNPDHQLLLANALLSGGRALEAKAVLEPLIAARPDWRGAQIALGQALEQLGSLDAAAAAFRRALADDPGGLAIAGLVRCLHALHRSDEAGALAREAHAARPSPHTALALARVLLAERRPAEAIALLQRTLDAGGHPPGVEIAIFFALGEAHEAMGDVDAAFTAFTRANSLFPLTFSRERLEARYRAWTDEVHPALRARDARAEVDASPCILIVGMPRSGTTLVEQVIASHPLAHGCGELPTLASVVHDLAQSMGGPYPGVLAMAGREQLTLAADEYVQHLRRFDPQAVRLTDKMPHNFELLGMAERMLPGARVIHCVRSPLDTCLSCFTTQLSPAHDYATSPENLGVAYGHYEKLMRRWRAALDLPILDVRYEDVVADFETQARRIIEFTGLAWDDACLTPWASGRAVATASVEQVRRPIYTSSVARAARYGERLRPLIDSLTREGVAPE